MSLLQPAVNRTAYAKIGIMGFAGSGKTFTASEIAIGLAKVHNSKNIAFFDTEKGSDFIIPKLKKVGIELLVHRGRAFADLITVIKEVEKEKIPVLIIDSISHVWRDLCDSYTKKYNKKSLTMYDWGILKGQWKEYTDLYINSSVHVLMLGRAGYEYEQGINEDSGKKEIIKTGTKMKVEGETGFEPDLLLEMERVETGEKIINRCWVIKDRSDTMNGRRIDCPKFESFKDFFGSINIGGDHIGFDSKRNSQELFDDPDWSVEETRKRKEIALEEIQAVLVKSGLDGRSAGINKKRIEVLESVFGTCAKTAIENMKLSSLLDGLQKLKEITKISVQAPADTALKEEDIPNWETDLGGSVK